MHFVRVLSKEYIIWYNDLNGTCWFSSNSVDFLDHIYGKVPKLLEQYEWYSLQKKYKNFSSNNNV